MKSIARQLARYFKEAIGIEVEARSWEYCLRLPQYLRDRYRFLRIDVLGIECVAMVDTEEKEQSPAVVRKHMDQVQARQEVVVVYARAAVTSYNRKRLIEHKVPFVVPGNQMYLPMLGIDLREHLKRLQARRRLFSPSTQVLVLHALWRKLTAGITPAETACRLGYSAMTMTRAFNELEAAGIGEHSVRGKERHLRFPQTGKHLWKTALPHMITPVRKRIYVAKPILPGHGSLAGLSAVARYTMASEPKTPVRALSADEWRIVTQQDKIPATTFPEPGGAELELWKYPPALFAREGVADRLSLYLSLKDDSDERVQSALDELLGGMEW